MPTVDARPKSDYFIARKDYISDDVETKDHNGAIKHLQKSAKEGMSKKDVSFDLQQNEHDFKRMSGE